MSFFYNQIQFTRPTKTPKNADGHHKKRKLAKSLASKNVSLSGNPNLLSDSNNNEESSERPIRKGGKNKRRKMQHTNDVYFCDAPSKNARVKISCDFIYNLIRIFLLDREYTHMVLVRSNGNRSLLEMDAVRAVCELETKLTSIGSFKGFCQVRTYSKECCRPWSLANYAAFLANKTSCSEIQARIIPYHEL